MNEKFYALPIEKQQAIINAGYRVFSKNSYKKSPMSEIADAAGISKSLLFHYFYNKKELYLFLLENCVQVTLDYLQKYHCYEQTDLFEMMQHGLQAKVRLMKEYPDMGAFVLKAYYEKDEEVFQDIQAYITKYGSYQSNSKLLKLDPEQFVPGLDLEMMYQDMYWAGEGYLWEILQCGDVDVEQMEQEFAKLIAFWKSIYLRREESYGRNQNN